MIRFLVLLLAGLLCVVAAPAQSPPEAPASVPVRLTALSTPAPLSAGAVGHFRAQIAPDVTGPVNYLWDLGDGTLSVGALVSHAYERPGAYPVTVRARNGGGADTLRTVVSVQAAAPPASAEAGPRDTAAVAPSAASAPAASAPRRTPRVSVPRAALFGPGGIDWAKGGYTWVLETDLWAARAQDRMRRHRLEGYRADLYVDTTGAGSPAHRLVIGQFATAAQARAARPWLPGAVRSPGLLALTPGAAPVADTEAP